MGLHDIRPVILSGGVGSRLWPVSRALYPKQLLPLYSDRSMLVEAAALVNGTFAAPIVVCADAHRFTVAEQLRTAGITPAAIILEPVGRNTAAAAAIGALAAVDHNPDALILVMPSDHVIGDATAFFAAVGKAAAAAERGRLVTFGIAAVRPETGYGYIRAGAPLLDADGVLAVERFVEKPDAATAATFVQDGRYAWNAGLFLVSATALLTELERFMPDVVAAARAAWRHATRDLDFHRLDETAFAACRSISLDLAVMEKTDRAAVVPVDMAWSDVGSWDALWAISDKDGAGNVLVGDIVTEAVSGSYVRSEAGSLTAVLGLSDVVVVATDDVVLVAQRDRAQDVKTIVDRLRLSGRAEPVSHTTVVRPWGSYRIIDQGSRFRVKHIVVNPGARLSLQYHHHRAEHWVVVEGTARVVCGERTFLLRENESTFISIGQVHRLENPGMIPLRLVEVQSGTYLDEDDIVRLDDTYGRIGRASTDPPSAAPAGRCAEPGASF